VWGRKCGCTCTCFMRASFMCMCMCVFLSLCFCVCVCVCVCVCMCVFVLYPVCDTSCPLVSHPFSPSPSLSLSLSLSISFVSHIILITTRCLISSCFNLSLSVCYPLPVCLSGCLSVCLAACGVRSLSHSSSLGCLCAGLWSHSPHASENSTYQ